MLLIPRRSYRTRQASYAPFRNTLQVSLVCVLTCVVSTQAFLDYAERAGKGARPQWPHLELRRPIAARPRPGAGNASAAAADEGIGEGLFVPDPPLPLLCTPGRLLRYSSMPLLRGAPLVASRALHYTLACVERLIASLIHAQGGNAQGADAAP